MAGKVDQKDLQKKYLTLQLLSSQIKQVEEQINFVEGQIAELTVARDAINSLGNVNGKAKSFAPVSRGIFVEAEVSSPKELLVNVGANIFVKKGIEETKKLISSQLEQLDKITSELNDNLIALSEQAQKLELELSNLA